MEAPLDRVESFEATIAVVDRTLSTTEVESLAAIRSAYTMCTAESGPLLQYLGAGYYVKRAPMSVKSDLEKKLKKAKEEAEKSAAKPVAEDKATKEADDTIEIVERYDSSDE
ncbi:hypothetical protein BgAZ_502640 [Babesia gibsoni]|uniref:Uncharacterized protein n=1 Tax=Babesia gibsoni TaxID=33632 RepID=A0AAD8PD90_BABGI|nr:hypothetical protein BgAZ_502640 [Babesia gibsoni]